MTKEKCIIKESEFASFEFDPKDAQIIDGLIFAIDEHAKKIFKFFEIVCEEKVEFKVLPTIEDYDNEIRKAHNISSDIDVSSWRIGCYKNKQIFLLSFGCLKDLEKFKTRTLEQYQKTAVHEFVHYVNDIFNKTRDCGNTERYLSEGIACYLSGQKDDKKINFDFSMEDVLTGSVSYDCYFALTKFLVENYKKDVIFELFESNRKAREFLQQELFERTMNYYKIKTSQ